MTFAEIVGVYVDGTISYSEMVLRVLDELPSDMPCSLCAHIDEFNATGDYWALSRRILESAGH